LDNLYIPVLEIEETINLTMDMGNKDTM